MLPIELAKKLLDLELIELASLLRKMQTEYPDCIDVIAKLLEEI